MEQDQISHLPKIILHDILSRLKEEEAARTSVLSKAWAETWSTFPILSFSDSKFLWPLPESMKDFVRQRKNFLNHVGKTLLRFREQGLAIKDFKLHIKWFDYMFLDVDFWMMLVTKSGVEVLELYYNEAGKLHYYILPTDVLEAKSLRKLVLMERIQVDLTFLNHSIKFFSLQVLSLWHVQLGDEKTIEYLISHCPLLESITLQLCLVLDFNGMVDLLSNIRIQSLPKLKEVNVRGIHEVYIDAPNLENLCYSPSVYHTPYKMDFDRCRNLRELYLQSLKRTIIITDEWFLELFLKFPFLETLKLVKCTVSKKINISSGQLKVLELSNCSNLEEANIDAPNLENLCYSPSVSHTPYKMDFDRCRNLRELYLQSLTRTIIITDEWFLELFLKFPFLENLKLVKCTMSKKINISSGQLKVLELSNCSNLEEANIDAPNLLLCSYYGYGSSKPIISFLRRSNQLEVKSDCQHHPYPSIR